MSETMIARRPITDSVTAYCQFDKLFKNVKIGIIVLTQENRIYYSNRYVQALFGYSKEEFTGKAVELLIHFGCRRQFEAYQQHYYHSHQAPDMGEAINLRALRKDGSQFAGVFNLNHYELEVKDLLIEFLPEITIRLKDRQLLL